MSREWTKEELAERFTVGGVEVTWGEATVEQHRARIKELEEIEELEKMKQEETKPKKSKL